MSERRLRRHPEALWLRSLRGVVILPPGADDATTVTSPGDLVWQLLDEPVTVEQLTDELAEALGAEAGTVHADLERLLEQLDTLGALA